MSDRDDGLAAFIAGVFIGGIIGAATMLLLAPQSGEETRTYIKDKSIELKDRAAVTYEDYYSRVGEFAETTKTKKTDPNQAAVANIPVEDAASGDAESADASSSAASETAPEE
jgi:gas vesicle protein